ncbi:MAG: tetratricopeptide repeat protein [Gammaproteobacteria bacterium]|nr:tetratricopeptide repeat protein [Gammaproteobacteria bacterium]
MAGIQTDIQQLLRQGKIAEARKLCRKTCRAQPGNPEAWAAMADVHIAADDFAAVAKSYRRVLKLQSDNCTAHYNLAIACSRLNRPDEAMSHLLKVIELDPHYRSAIVMLAEYYRSVGNYARSIPVLQKGAIDNPDSIRISWLLGLCLQDTGELEAAVVHFSAACHLMRSCEQQPQEFYPTRDPKPGDTFRHTSTHKLKHDVEQFEYLMKEGLLPRSFADTVNHYRAILTDHGQKRGPVSNGPLSPADTARIGDSYNRLIYKSTKGSNCNKPLNQNVDWQAAVADYQSNQPGMTYIDNLLQPEALRELYEYCLESTIWFDFRHNGYVGTYADDGFDNPILFRIAEGLRTAMPELLKDHPVKFVWAYQYDQQLSGIGTHADSAAVNVNFWVTPDDANLDPDSGGLIVYDVEAPADWDFNKYNNDNEAIQRFLKRENANSMQIPYRRNRAVIFNSDLFHKTDNFQFREGYENRRINITMLFGDRVGKN